MIKRKRIYVGCLSVILLLFTALAVAYACLIFMPTGYAEFEGTQAATLKAVHDALNPQSTPNHALKSALAPTSLTVTLPLSNIEVLAHNNVILALKQINNPNDLPAPADSGDPGLINYMLFNKVGKMDEMGMGLNGDIIATITRYTKINHPERIQLKHPELIEKALQGKLDEIERFLSNSASCPFPTFDSFDPQFRDYNLCGYAILAAIRACEAEDWDRATTILENYLHLKKRIHLASFPINNNLFGYNTTIYFLRQYDRFPDANLARIQKALEEINLSPDELERLRKAHAIRAGKRYREEAKDPGTVADTWHYFALGKPDLMLTRTLAPVLDRQFEELVIAWAIGSEKEIQIQEARVEATRRLMNLTFSPLRLYYTPDQTNEGDTTVYHPYQPTHEERARLRGEFFNDDLNRLILAALRYRQATGHYPDSLGALTPKYLGPLPNDTPLKLYRLPPPANQDHSTSTTVTESFAIGHVEKDQTVWLRYPIAPPIPEELRALVRKMQ